jgi:hypothetical protein
MGWRSLTGVVELVWLRCAHGGVGGGCIDVPTIRRRRFGGERMHLDVAKETVTEYYYW